jgi:hypothetical protein
MLDRIAGSLVLGVALAAAPSPQTPSPQTPPPQTASPPAASSQPAPSQSPAAGSAAGKTALTLTGCVARADIDRFTLDDAKNGTFELKGKALDRYIGKRVEVRGSSSGLHITGGLWPSPNVAAQAGGLDPAQAAVAAMPGGGTQGTGPESLPQRASGR